MSEPTFVCAFRGRRDDYQVPLALAEYNLLSGFVTDIYATPRMKRLGKAIPGLSPMLDFRYKSGIPVSAVHQSPLMAFREFALRRDADKIEALRDIHDELLSMRAAKLANRQGAHLFLYSPYAVPAFDATYRHAPKKILFQYHPHHLAEYAILRKDAERYRLSGELAWARKESTIRVRRVRTDDVWRHADHIICASSFTARTLIEAGADASRISVVSYGVDVPERRPVQAASEVFRVLFVGSGIQRKGLHHLLRAWTQASLPSSAELTIVARVLDESMVDLARQAHNIRFVRGLTAAQLVQEYRTSSLFCMPSLVEGFGQVYLEALAEGLPVLGTRNTCLPDLGGEVDGVFLTETGNVQGLCAQLERLSLVVPGNSPLKEAAARTAEKYSWDKFRRRIAEICDSTVATLVETKG